ncbi:hypothetical protein PUNSTDRAFT_117441 [Punctularia strigosozonata HHB-11173 SS5]|uniref:uncharacterized protein n=1 Tax=Punctularia strigosozonata (strain HHB-11173) TaxID=741275 RepID=UPI0004416444|nr:uncharacterized protein PUNSTDRAFT_117441 [Punctularia strigosozonata HHB-11173 SS5]EIN13752.1 hypothetical protein PUNSTDRAFT_117441 [Punctularia strigosozonata HHB-11173 SS5]
MVCNVANHAESADRFAAVLARFLRFSGLSTGNDPARTVAGVLLGGVDGSGISAYIWCSGRNSACVSGRGTTGLTAAEAAGWPAQRLSWTPRVESRGRPTGASCVAEMSSFLRLRRLPPSPQLPPSI